jgi:hypothetical protein
MTQASYSSHCSSGFSRFWKGRAFTPRPEPPKGGTTLPNQLPRLSERRIDLADTSLPPPRAKSGFAAAFAADDGGDGLDDLAGLDLGLVIFGDAGDQRDVAAAGGGEDDDAVELPFKASLTATA